MVQKSEGKRKSLEEICEMGAGFSSSWHQGQHGPMVSWHCRAPSCHTGCFAQSSVLKMQPEKSLVRCHTIKIPMPAPWVGKQRFKKTSQEPRAVFAVYNPAAKLSWLFCWCSSAALLFPCLFLLLEISPNPSCGLACCPQLMVLGWQRGYTASRCFPGLSLGEPNSVMKLKSVLCGLPATLT